MGHVTSSSYQEYTVLYILLDLIVAMWLAGFFVQWAINLVLRSVGQFHDLHSLYSKSCE